MKVISSMKSSTIALGVLGFIIGFTSMELFAQLTLLVGN